MGLKRPVQAPYIDRHFFRSMDRMMFQGICEAGRLPHGSSSQEVNEGPFYLPGMHLVGRGGCFCFAIGMKLLQI